MTPEARVGLLVILVGLLVAGIAIFLGGYMGRLATYDLTAYFADAQGLRREAKVQLAGVRIGTVYEVALRPHKQFPGKPVAVTMAIQSGTPLYETDRFNIKQHGLLGDEYVAVTRLPVGKTAKLLSPNAVVEGGMATSTEVIMEQVQGVVADAKATLAMVSGRVDNEQMWADISATLANLNKATAGATDVVNEALRFTQSLSRTGEQSERKVAQLLDHIVAAAADVEKAAGRVDRLIALSPLPMQLAASGENIRQATSDIAVIAAEAREMAQDPQMQDYIAQSAKNLRDASANVAQVTHDAAALIGDQQLAADIKATLENVRQASESLKKLTEHTESLLTDPKTTEDLRASLENLRAATESGRTAAERADGVLDGVESAMETMRKTQSMFKDMDTRTRLQLRAAQHSGLRADAYLDLRLSPTQEDYWRVGVRDLGDSELLELQWSHRLRDDWFRAGVFGNKLGLGYDYTWGRGRLLEAELYNPSDLRLDVRARLRLRDQYDLLLGIEDLGGSNDPFLGAGYQGDF